LRCKSNAHYRELWIDNNVELYNSMKTKIISVLYAFLFAVAWFIHEYVLVGALAFAVVPLFIGGFVLWWLTTYRTQIDPNQIIVPYLLTVIAFIAHVYEEYKAYVLGFPDVLQGGPFALNLDLLLTFAAFLAPILWLLGAVMMLKRWPVGYFTVSTFLFGMMFIEPTHFLAPFLQDGTFHYVGGMWTAILPIALGWYTFLLTRREMQRSKEPQGTATGNG
jgi:hypothetical protein